MIRKLEHIFLNNILRTVFYSLVHPQLVYCITVWSSIFAVHLHPLRVLQNKVVRVLTGVDKRSSVSSRYVEHCREFYNALFMFKYQNNWLPNCFSGLFLPLSSVHEHNTRSSSQYRNPRVVTTRSKFSVRHVCPSAWNTLPHNIVQESNPTKFRSLLKEFEGL